jgi:predicted RNA binding protein YcfA (HicA-like mRNA interferase family)
MPKFPGLSGAQKMRALEKLGFVVTRQSGSRIVMRRNGQGCVVPSHKEVKVGTVNGVLRQMGVTAEEFKSAL